MFQTDGEKIKTHILRSINFFSENCAVCDIQKNMVGQMTILHGACALHAG
jgi:hypothetical protein